MPKGNKPRTINMNEQLKQFSTDIRKMAPLLKNHHFSDKEFIERCEKYKKELYEASENINTRATRLASANQVIKSKLGDEKYALTYNIMKPSKEDKKKQIAERKEIDMSKLQQRTKINYDEYKNAINKFKTSDKYDELIVCVSLATGRRYTEIAKTGIFTETKDEHYITFGGALKKRGVSTQPAEIPIIELTSSELVNMIKKIRRIKNVSKLTNIQVASGYYIKKVNDTLKSIFGDNITTEIIRGAYASICYKLYSDQSISEVLYGSKILLHKEGDLNTFAQNYQKVFVDMNNYSDVAALTRKVDELIKLVKELKREK